MGIAMDRWSQTLKEIERSPSFWERLAARRLPAVLYGMGDGADKSLEQCRRHHIPVAAVFASPGFVRGQQYQGFPVKTLAQVERELYPGGVSGAPRFVVLLCFASERPEVLRLIDGVAGRHPLSVPDFPVCGEALFTPQLVAENRAALEELYGLLADNQSRRVLEGVMQAKLTGDPRFSRRCETARWEMLSKMPLGDGAVFVDAGAYTGDTVEKFVQEMVRRHASWRRIVAIEPDRRNYRGLCRRAAALPNGGGSIQCVQAGVWSAPGIQPFSHRSGRMASVGGAPDGGTVAVDSVDHLLGGERASLIKYDVEGAEEQALLGSTETIRRWRPALSVAVYHRSGDLFTLPLLIHRLCPAYRLYLRHHPYLPAWETLCYAIAE